MSKHSVEEIKAVILGHAVGDALGVPVEFQTREGLEADPVTDMRGYGTYPVPVGSWSDDTSMTLCALDALAQKSFLWDAVIVVDELLSGPYPGVRVFFKLPDCNRPEEN